MESWNWSKRPKLWYFLCKVWNYPLDSATLLTLYTETVLQINFFPISIVLLKFEASQYLPKLGFWNKYPLCDVLIVVLSLCMLCSAISWQNSRVLCWCVIWLWLFLDIFFEVTYLVCDLIVALSGHLPWSNLFGVWFDCGSFWTSSLK